MIKAKFRCNSVEKMDLGGGKSEKVQLTPVYAPDDPESENGLFWAATPSGKLEMHITNPDGLGAFEPGEYYYLDIIRAATPA